MRFYTKQHKYYCGIDIHARKMYLCILDETGEIRLHRNIITDREEVFLKTIHPFQEGFVVTVECMFTWYWIADLCNEHDIPFFLAHALYMKAIYGRKAKNDKIDSRKIAVLLRGSMIAMAYNLPEPLGCIAKPRDRHGIVELIKDTSVQKMIDTDLAIIQAYDPIVAKMKWDII